MTHLREGKGPVGFLHRPGWRAREPEGGQTHRTASAAGPGATSEAASVEELGFEIREAVETGDVARAARLRVERDAARSGSTMATTEPPAPPAGGVLDEIGGLADDRLEELKTGFLIGIVLGDPDWQARAVLAAIVGQPVRLARLEEERKVFETAGFTPQMWDEELMQRTSPPPIGEPIKALASLTSDARSLLALNALLRRRITATCGRLGAHSLLRPARVQAALDELARHELADRSPTVEDRLSKATMAQLAELRSAHGIRGARSKVETIRRILSSVPEDAVWDWMRSTDPVWVSDDVVAVGVTGGSEAVSWYEAFARLFAHSLQFQLYRQRDIASLQRARFPGWEILKTDDCPVCREGPNQVAASEPERLPPFHLGCRCAVVPVLRDPETGRYWLPPMPST